MPILSTNSFNFANLTVKSSGTWNATNYIWTKSGDEWHKVTHVSQKTGGTWQSVWPTEGVVQFTSSFTGFRVPPGISYADILLVGGGGGGGQGSTSTSHNGAGGGGGGGGVVEKFGVEVTAGHYYDVVVGRGGDGAPSNSNSHGQPGGTTTLIGPAGAWHAFGGTGGSGGAGQDTSNPGGGGGGGYCSGDTPNAGHPTAGGAQGYAGGFGAAGSYQPDSGGGGGGAGGRGGNASLGVAGEGGIGFSSPIANPTTVIFYGGGGAGGVTVNGSPASGGTGGGGSSGEDGKDNTGGGGGGGGSGSDSAAGPFSGRGGSGVVVINFYAALDRPASLEIDSGTGGLDIPVGSETISRGSDGGCCVVSTAFAETGLWRKRDRDALIVWCEKSLHNRALGECFRRGYQVLGSKVIVPAIKRPGKLGDLYRRYYKWAFNNGTNLVRGKKSSIWALPSSVLWISAFLAVGAVVTKDYATQSWKNLYKK